MSVIVRPVERRVLARVLACVTAPADPREIYELAAADVVVDPTGARLEALHAETFRPDDQVRGGTNCTPMHVTAAVWGGRSPDILVAYDAVTASLTFTQALTGGLPWMSLHPLARRVWPGQHSYELYPLACWRAWAGPHGPFSSRLPSGAEREAELAAGIFVELLQDPGLCDVAEAAWLEQAERSEALDQTSTCIRAHDAIEAALFVSALPAKPLKEPPWPFDDQAEWATIGLEDLRHHARYSGYSQTAEAALAELQSRLVAADRRVDCLRYSSSTCSRAATI